MLQDAPSPTLPSDTEITLPTDALPSDSNRLPRYQSVSFSTEPPAESADNSLLRYKPDPPEPTPDASTSQYGRLSRPTQCMVKSKRQQAAVIVAYSSYDEVMYRDDCNLQDELYRPVAFMAKNNAGTMQFGQAMQAPESAEFMKECIKEVNDHIKHNHWRLIPRSKVPTGTKILS